MQRLHVIDGGSAQTTTSVSSAGTTWLRLMRQRQYTRASQFATLVADRLIDRMAAVLESGLLDDEALQDLEQQSRLWMGRHDLVLRIEARAAASQPASKSAA